MVCKSVSLSVPMFHDRGQGYSCKLKYSFKNKRLSRKTIQVDQIGIDI